MSTLDPDQGEAAEAEIRSRLVDLKEVSSKLDPESLKVVQESLGPLEMLIQWLGSIPLLLLSFCQAGVK